MKKSVNIKIIALLIVVALITSAGMIFTYWSTGYTGASRSITPENNVTIGTGGTTSTTLTLDTEGFTASGALVPGSVAPGSGQTQEITFETNVKWQSDAYSIVSGVEGTVTISCADIAAGDSSLTEADKGLFVITYTPNPCKVTGDYAEGTDVTIKITMTEPSDAVQYGRVAGKNLTFTFDFSVA